MPDSDEVLKQEAERDAAQWTGMQSALDGDSEIGSFTEAVDINLDKKTGKVISDDADA